MDEIESLRREVAELRTAIDAVDDWANGIQAALVAILPFLLRGHPAAGKVEDLLRLTADRYAELSDHPERARAPDETAGLHEAGKMLYWQLALLGALPGIDPAEAARQSLTKSAPGAPRRRG